MNAAEDVHAVQNLKSRYCATADRSAHDPAGARAAFGQLFAPEIIADYGFGELVGAEQTAEFMCTTVPGNSAWMLHMLHSPLVEISGDIATGEWTVMVHAKRRSDEQIEVVVGRYADKFRRTDAGWRIARVRFTQMT